MLPLRDYTTLLRNRNFVLLCGGQTVSLMGDEIFHVALLWAVVQLTGSPLALSSIFLTMQIPWLALQPLSGTVADRFNRQRIMLASDLLRGLAVGFVALLVLLDRFALWQLYALAFVFGAVGAFFKPARSALLPSLVAPAELAAANGLMMGTAQIIEITGPALGGFLLVWAGMEGVSALNALSFFIGALGIWLLRCPAAPSAATQPSRPFLRESLAALQYLRAKPAILALLGLVGVLNFVSAPIGAFLPLFAQQVLKVGPEGFGFLLSGGSVGALVGAFLAGVFPHRHRGAFLLIFIILAGLFWFACFGWAPNLPAAVGLFGLGGLMSSIGHVLFITLLQSATAPEYRGRLASIAFLLAGGLQPIAFGLMGGLAEWVGFQPLMLASCLLAMGAGMLGLFSKGLRQLH